MNPIDPGHPIHPTDPRLRAPTLTEVLDLPLMPVQSPPPGFERVPEPMPAPVQDQPDAPRDAASDVEVPFVVPHAPTTPHDAIGAVDADRISAEVLAQLQRRIDQMLEYRLRELLAPMLARAADTLVQEARVQLAATMRDVLQRAVAQEISRHRGK